MSDGEMVTRCFELTYVEEDIDQALDMISECKDLIKEMESTNSNLSGSVVIEPIQADNKELYVITIKIGNKNGECKGCHGANNSCSTSGHQDSEANSEGDSIHPVSDDQDIDARDEEHKTD